MVTAAKSAFVGSTPFRSGRVYGIPARVTEAYNCNSLRQKQRES